MQEQRGAFHQNNDLASQLCDLAAVKEQLGPLNPMFNSEIDADLKNYRIPGTSGITEIGQPVVEIDLNRVNPFCVDVVTRLKNLAGLQSVESEEFVFQNFFREMNGAPRPSQILDVAKNLVSGVAMNPTTKRPELIRATPGEILDVIQPFFVLVQGAAWSHAEFSVFHPLKSHRGQPAFPMMGELWLDGEPLSDEVLSQTGISPCGAPVTDAQGEQSTTLARCNAFRSGGRAFLLPARAVIPLLPTPEGGYRIVSLDELEESSDRDHVTWKPVVAFQYTGVGMPRYVYHAAKKDEAGRVYMDESKDVIIKAQALPERVGVELVQRSQYAGRSGIFLDVRHQVGGTSPSGGLADDTITIERDALLLRHGATMGGVTINSAPLLQRAKLEEILGRPLDLPWEHLQVLVRAIFDASHRLSVFSLATGELFAREILPEILGTTKEEFPAEVRNDYLNRLATTLGRNAAICLKLSLTLPTDQVAIDNLNIFGGILDSENFVPMRSRYEALGVIKLWMETLVTVASACGVQPNDFRQSQIIESFARALLPTSFKAEKFWSSLPKKSFEDADQIGGLLGIMLTVDWVEQSMSRDRVAFSVAELLRFFKQNSSDLQRVFGRASPSNSDLSRWIANGLPDPVVFTKISRSDSSVVRHEIPSGAFIRSLALGYIGSQVIAHQRRIVSPKVDPAPTEVREVPY